jgi:hypothetical protein
MTEFFAYVSPNKEQELQVAAWILHI